MQQKVIWFILFLIISGLTFYWVVIRDSELSRYDDNKKKFEGLTEDVTETTEIHDDFKTMWIGRGKHIETIQANIKSFKNEYNKKMKKIDEEFDEVENSIDKAEKRMTGLIENLESDLEDFEDKYKTFKKTTNRKIKDIEFKIIPPMKSELKGLGESLQPIANLKLIKDAIEEERKKKEKEEGSSSNPN